MYSSTTKKKFVTKSMRYIPSKKVLGKKLDFDSEISIDLDNHLTRSILNIKQNQENKFQLQFSQNKIKRSMHGCLTDRTSMLNSTIDLTVYKTTKQLNTIQQSFLNSPDIVKNGSMRQIVMTKKNSLICSVKQSNTGIIILTSKQLQQIRQYDKELHKVYLQVYRAYRNALQEQQKLNQQDKNLQKQCNECNNKKQNIIIQIAEQQLKLKFLEDKSNDLTVKWIKKLKSSCYLDKCVKRQ